jgi:nucleotide-binding universal stress UspA family protein
MTHDSPPEGAEMTGIVVGFDDSEGGLAALRWAMDESVRRHEPLTVVTVVNELPVAVPAFYAIDEVGHVEDRRESTRKWVTHTVEELSARRVGSGIPLLDIDVVSGHPAKTLIDRSEGATLLVVGSRGAGGFSRLLLGSVSTAVVHHAKCPVVVVPTPGEDR